MDVMTEETLVKRSSGFTLTELLVLAPITFLLGAVLLASLGDAQQKVQAAACLANMRQWGLAMGMYCNDYHDYMPYEGSPTSPIDAGFNLGAWFNVLPPYMHQASLKDLYTSVPPITPLPGQRSVYLCPSVTSPRADYTGTPTTSHPYFGYAMNRLLTGISGKLYQRSIAALPAQVIMFSESENNEFPWTDGYFIGPNSPVLTPPRHFGGMNFVFVDGHAQWYLLADYGRPAPMTTPQSAQIEWAVPRAVYWFPCRTCNKG